MSRTPEGRVKRKVVEQLTRLGAYYFFPVAGPFGRSGVPDIIGCHKGRFFAIECKAGRNVPTKLQEMQMDDIRAAGGRALVVNEHNVEEVTPWLVKIVGLT